MSCEYLPFFFLVDSTCYTCIPKGTVMCSGMFIPFLRLIRLYQYDSCVKVTKCLNGFCFPRV